MAVSIDNCSRYQALFENSPIAIWEEDFSQSKKFITSALPQEETNIESFLENHPHILIEAAQKIKILDANDTAIALFETTTKENFINNYSNIFCEETTPLFLDFIKKVISGKSTADHDLEVVAQTHKGKKLILNLSWAVAPQEKENFSCLWFYAVDTTEKVRTKNALIESESQYKKLFESIMDSFFYIELKRDKSGAINDVELIKANKAFYQTIKIGENLTHFESAEMLLKTNDLYWIEEFETVDRNKKSLKFEKFSKSLNKHLTVEAHSPQNNHVACHFVDITDRINAEELRIRLQQEEKYSLVGKIAGGMAHDFNNILGVIMGSSELILNSNPPADIQTDAQIILDTAERGRELTKNLLLFAKSQDTRFEKIDLNSSLSSLIHSLKTELTNVRVTLELDWNIDHVIGDINLIENAYTNLIQNAIHATKKSGRPHIAIKTKALPEGYEVSITDNGCGIPLDVQDKIFEPTFTLKGNKDKSHSYPSSIKGSGYGLMNVQRCVELHEGQISLQSKINQGTTFILKFPKLDERQVSSQYPTPVSLSPVQEKRGHILVVEDEPFFAKVLRSILERDGHTISIANTAQQAIEMSKIEDFDLISLDYTLPDNDGFYVYETIRKTNKNIPILFVSGNVEFMESTVALLQQDPKAAHIAKPFRNVSYRRKVQAAINDSTSTC